MLIFFWPYPLFLSHYPCSQRFHGAIQTMSPWYNLREWPPQNPSCLRSLLFQVVQFLFFTITESGINTSPRTIQALSRPEVPDQQSTTIRNIYRTLFRQITRVGLWPLNRIPFCTACHVPHHQVVVLHGKATKNVSLPGIFHGFLNTSIGQATKAAKDGCLKASKAATSSLPDRSHSRQIIWQKFE